MSHARAVPVGHAEPHDGGMATRLNWLRAAVLGANDGIVSTAGLVVGVAGRYVVPDGDPDGGPSGPVRRSAGDGLGGIREEMSKRGLARIYESKGLQPPWPGMSPNG